MTDSGAERAARRSIEFILAVLQHSEITRAAEIQVADIIRYEMGLPAAPDEGGTR